MRMPVSSVPYQQASTTRLVRIILNILALGMFLFPLVTALTTAAAAPSQEKVYLFINSKDWHDAILLSMYAYEKDVTPFIITSLGDAQIKMQSLPPGARVILYESHTPVVKNFAKTLRVNGYAVEDHTYQDYRDLQRSLPLKDALFIVHPQFSTAALSLLPLAIWQNASIRFEAHATSAYRRKRVDIIAGDYSIRDSTRFMSLYPEATLITGYPIDVAYRLSNLTGRILPGDWYIYMHPSAVDVHPFPQQPEPILLSLGYLDEEAGIIRSTNRTRLEIISPLLADTAKALEKTTRQDLKLIVKYGRTVTKIPGLEGRILPLDTIRTDYPFIALTLTDVLLNPKARTLTLRVRNTGTIPALVYTTVEYADTSHADDQPWIILPNETASIIHPLDTLPADVLSLPANTTAGNATITIRYDYREPLRKTYAEDGRTILVKPVTILPDEEDRVRITGVYYRPWQDELIISLLNPTQEQVTVDLSIPLLNLSSYPIILTPQRETQVTLSTRHIPPEDMPKDITILLAYGREKPTLFTLSSASILTQSRVNPLIFLSGILLSVILLILFTLRRRRLLRMHKGKG